MRRSSSPASISSGRSSACRSTICSAASCATRCRSPAISSSATRIRKPGRARCARRSSSSRMRRSSRARTASARTSSRAASSRPTTSWSATARSPPRFPATAFATTRTRRSRVEEAIRFGQAIEDLRNDYLEDPTWGLNGMRRVRSMRPGPARRPTRSSSTSSSSRPTSSIRAVDVILLDTTFWGGIRPCIKAAGRVRDLPARASPCIRPASSASSSRRCCTSAPCCRTSPSPPTPTTTTSSTTSSRAGRCATRTARSPCPTGPGLGVKLDREQLRQYRELYQELGGYAYDRDPGRPGWFPLVPNDRWADPSVSLSPQLR